MLRMLSILTLIAPAITVSLAFGQSSNPEAKLLAAWKENPQVRQCGLCHYSAGNEFASRDTDFCRLIEAKLWLSNDKHAIARRRIEPSADNKAELSNRLSYAIALRLGYDIETLEGYKQFRNNCLTCHAGYQAGEEPEEFEKNSHNRPGISCTVCHQMGSDVRWIDEHSSFNAKNSWRNTDPKSKAAKGMRNLVTVGEQADLCLQCHIGDIKQNRFVTHEMYAAGHPPLPSVELGALLDAMPRHWRTNAELFQSLQALPERVTYFERNLEGAWLSQDPPIHQLHWQVQTIVVGALAAQKQILSLVEQASSDGSSRWGDYALYDCAGCHHELKASSLRQAARHGNAPGRPQLAVWPQSLSNAAMKLKGEDAQLMTAQLMTAQLMTAQSMLQLAINEKPFGNRHLVGQRAAELGKLISGYRTQLNREALQPAFSVRYLRALTEIPESQLVDYHAARQINWAIRGIDAQLASLGVPLPKDLRAGISKLGLHSGVVQVGSLIPSQQNSEIFPSFAAEELKRQSAYDPQQFAAQLHSIQQLLP